MLTMASKRICRLLGATIMLGAVSSSALAQTGPSAADKERYQRYLATKTPAQLKALRQLAQKNDKTLEGLLWHLEKAAGVTLGGEGTTGPKVPPPPPSR